MAPGECPLPHIPGTPVRKGCRVRGWMMGMVMQFLLYECGFAEKMSSGWMLFSKWKTVGYRLPFLCGLTPRFLFSVPGSLAVPDQCPFSQPHSAEGQGEGAERAGVRAAEPQERQRRQPRYEASVS